MQVSCRGDEADIDDCTFKEGECKQEKYMSVFCSTDTLDEQAGASSF